MLTGRMAKKVEPLVLNPSATLKTGAPDTILALGRRGDRILAASTTSLYEWSELGELLRVIPPPWDGGTIEVAAFSEEGSDAVLSRMGGSKLSGVFSSVGHYRLTDSGLEDLGWSEDLPRAEALSFSPDGTRVAFQSGNWGSGGSMSLTIGPTVRYPALPPHGETLGDRQAAEASLKKGKVTTVACSNDATYVFEAQRALRFEAHDGGQLTEWAIKGIQKCWVLANGDFVTVDKSGKLRKYDARGGPIWESKARGSKCALRASPDGRFVMSQWVLSAATGAAVGQLQDITGLSLGVLFVEDSLYVSSGPDVLRYPLEGVVSD